MFLDQRRIDGKLFERRSLLLAIPIEIRVAFEMRPNLFECALLEFEDLRPLDERSVVERRRFFRELRKLVAERLASARDFFDAQVQWVAEAATRRRIRARLLIG